MTQTVHGIICYLIVGIMVVVVTAFRSPETVETLRGQSALFPSPINTIVFYILLVLLVILFPLVLLKQLIHFIWHRRVKV